MTAAIVTASAGQMVVVGDSRRALEPRSVRTSGDLVGRRFGRLTVTARAASAHSKRTWFCACDCGGQKTLATGQLTSGKTSSCGCLQRESAGAINRKHGLYSTSTHVAWRNMVRRCHYPGSTHYDNYGGRGIAVCERWRESFESFLADMGERPSPAHTVERLDNARGYEVGNVVWATRREQNNNRRNNRWIEHNGRRMTMAQWSEESGVPYGRLKSRLNAGWPVDRALQKRAEG